MTATTVALSTRTSVLEPCYSFPGRKQVERNPRFTAGQFDAHHFLTMEDSRGRPWYSDLWSDQSPKPADAYNVLVLTGGRQQYYRSMRYKSSRGPWLGRLTNGDRDAYVVWGRRNADGFRVFDPNKTHRTSNGRGVIYSRWPVFDDRGELTDYRWQIARIEFGVRDRNPARPNSLMLKVDHTMGFVDDMARPYGHHLPTYEIDEIDEDWRELQLRAKEGFERHCTDQVDPATKQWHDWFRDQRLKQASDETLPWDERFSQTCQGRGWWTALESVQEAWQLDIVLAEYRHLFPQVPPDCTLSSDPEQDLREARGEVRFIRDPGYSGTIGDMDGRLLAAYLERRPERAEQFHQWMNDYVALLSNLRNYTGD